MKDKKVRKKYLIELEETRSIVALAASILIFIFALAAVLVMALQYDETQVFPLQYYTVLSNLLTAVTAAMMIPYAVEGIRKKRFVLPRWVVVLQYASATSIAITMIASLTVIWPVMGSTTVTGTGFWLHVFVPVCNVILFQCVETGVNFTWRDTILAEIPFWIYTTVYLIEVAIIGEENGGWEDIYMVKTQPSVWIPLIAILALGFGIAVLLRVIQNKHSEQSRKRITGLWKEKPGRTELLIEAFGLGRYYGSVYSYGELSIPLDIFTLMSEWYEIPLEDMTKAYMKGALDAMNERRGS